MATAAAAETDGVLAARLRVFAAAAIVVGAATGAVAFMAAERVYTNGVLTAEHDAGGASTGLMLLVVFAPVLIGLRRPSRAWAIAWIAWPPVVAMMGVLWALASVAKDLGEDAPGIVVGAVVETYTHPAHDVVVRQALWPETAVGVGMATLAALFLIVLPLILVLTSRARRRQA